MHRRSPERRVGLRLLLLTALAIGALLAPAAANAQATRTWISGVGDDVNPCSRTAPCKTLAGAISKTAAGGEINAIDSGGFGAVTITKSITIDLSPQLGGVLVTGTNGISVNAGADADVILRGINFVAVPPSTPQLSGVRILSARTVRIENSSFSGFGSTTPSNKAASISVTPTAANTSVVVDNVDIRVGVLNGIGILVDPAATFTATVTVRNSTILGYFTTPVGTPATSTGTTGLQVGLGGTAWLVNSTVFGNCLGLVTTDLDNVADHGVINAYTNSQVVGNWSDGTPTSIIGQPDPQGPTGAIGAGGTAGTTGATGATGTSGTSTARIVVESVNPALKARAGARVRFAYVSTAAGTSTLTVRSGKTTIATITGRAKIGHNALRWNGRVQGKAAKPGTYRLVLKVAGPDGRVATTSSDLVLR